MIFSQTFFRDFAVCSSSTNLVETFITLFSPLEAFSVSATSVFSVVSASSAFLAPPPQAVSIRAAAIKIAIVRFLNINPPNVFNTQVFEIVLCRDKKSAGILINFLHALISPNIKFM